MSGQFAVFVRHKGWPKILLRGPSGTVMWADILYGKHGKKTVKIGVGWMEFRLLNEFIEGQCLRFFFKNVQQNLARVDIEDL